MKVATFGQILRVVQETNILPLVSVCNIKCAFCSHKNNPEGLGVYTLPKLDDGEIEELIEYLSPDRKIVIGESASRIVEGEPFLHKNFMYILKRIREKYKFTPIQITSNGSYLTEEIVKELSGLEPIEMNISLNSSSAENRRKLICDKKPETAINGCTLLKKCGVKYNGSLVAMPHIVGWDDIRNTIVFLCENGAQMVRVFVPGYTKYSKEYEDFTDIYKGCQAIVNDIRCIYDTTIIIEPPLINNLDVVVEGVIKGSPAQESGIESGDIIISVNGQKAASRVDAYNKAFKSKDSVIEVRRGNELIKFNLKKCKNISAGFVVVYDINPEIGHDIRNIIKRKGAERVLIITSELAHKAIELLLDDNSNQVKIVPARNNFFGGSIKVSGLLTVGDIVSAAITANNEYDADLIIVPGAPFDYYGNDLAGAHYTEISQEVGIEVVVV